MPLCNFLSLGEWLPWQDGIGNGDKIAFTGGVALNDGVRKSLEKELGKSFYVPKKCQLVGALRVALIGREIVLGKK